jgi:preprotein translocase subunit SecF
MSALSDLYRGRNDFDFPKWWRPLEIISLTLVLVSILALGIRGLNLSIDFEGGSVWEVPSESLTEDGAREALDEFGPTAVERFQVARNTDGERVVRISGRVDSVEEGARAGAELAQAAGLETGDVTVSTVGPSWGQDITNQARLSLIVFLVLITAYITWRLEARMAIAALVAVVHDVLITVGIYALFQFPVTPATVISFLTILGFSLYDTIVVFDRVRDNAGRIGRTGQYTYTAIMRRSLNQVFMRSVNTSIVSVLPVISLLVLGQWAFGQDTLGDFSLALLIGLLSGAYSSLFVAPPVTAWLKEREPRFQEIRKRLGAKGVDTTDTSWHGLSAPALVGAGARVPGRPSSGSTSVKARAATRPAEAMVPAGGDPGGDTTANGDRSPVGAAPVVTNFGGHPPRPRKKRKR